jgi:hypothetical protein
VADVFSVGPKFEVIPQKKFLLNEYTGDYPSSYKSNTTKEEIVLVQNNYFCDICLQQLFSYRNMWRIFDGSLFKFFQIAGRCYCAL